MKNHLHPNSISVNPVSQTRKQTKNQHSKHAIFRTLLKTMVISLSPFIVHNAFMMNYFQQSQCYSLPILYTNQNELIPTENIGITLRQWFIVDIASKIFELLILFLAAYFFNYSSTKGILMYALAYLTIISHVIFQVIWSIIAEILFIEVGHLLENTAIGLPQAAGSSDSLIKQKIEENYHATLSNLEYCRNIDPSRQILFIQKTVAAFQVIVAIATLVVCMRWRVLTKPEEKELSIVARNENQSYEEQESTKSKGQVDTISEYLKHEIQRYHDQNQDENSIDDPDRSPIQQTDIYEQFNDFNDHSYVHRSYHRQDTIFDDDGQHSGQSMITKPNPREQAARKKKVSKNLLQPNAYLYDKNNEHSFGRKAAAIGFKGSSSNLNVGNNNDSKRIKNVQLQQRRQSTFKPLYTKPQDLSTDLQNLRNSNHSYNGPLIEPKDPESVGPFISSDENSKEVFS